MITKDFFIGNRSKLRDALAGGIFVGSAYATMQRSNDTAFSFEQEANFWWLTGIDAPNWRVIIDTQKTWLIMPHVSESAAIFEGSLSPDDALALSGVDGVLTQDEAQKKLRDMAKKHAMVYVVGKHIHAEYFDFTLNPAQRTLELELSRVFKVVHDCQKELAQCRAIKQPVEIEAMKRAITVTAEAFALVKKSLQTFKHEYEIEAEFNYWFRKNGAKGHAYDPIVAAGKNACTLHYTNNSAKLHKRQFILLDIGARHNGYAADITRTYAFGEPTKRQKQVHDAVVWAQKEIIAYIKPDMPIEQYQREVDTVMQKALYDLGLMYSLNDEENYRKYFPHAVSHGLGVDVHDSLGAPKYLRQGMVLTVEPGIYIPEESIGVRIEDDILVTDVGNQNLSGMLSTNW